MAEDHVQPPRYTSTPLANRNTSNILNNFIEVSPIFSTPERIKKAKSLIPVLKTNEIRPRSNGIRSTGAKTSSTNIIASKKIATEVLPPRAETHSADRNAIDQAVLTKGTRKTQDPKPVPRKTPQNYVDEAILPKSTKKSQVRNAMPGETPQNLVDEAIPVKSTKKTQVPKAVPGETPQNLVDEAIPAKITNKSLVCVAVPGETPQNYVDEDVVQSKLSRVSKISQRPSTLPRVPEEASIEGAGQLSEDCILKTTKTQSGWLIPKDTKVSLKRKSSVPCTVTKRNKNIEINSKEDDESLFDSPELPNLVEVSSLCGRRKTYTLKKKPEITDIQEECHESVIDGIIPLEVISQKSPITNVSVKSMQRNSKEKPQKTTMRKNNKMCEQTAPKNKLEERNGGKENIELPGLVSPDVEVYTNKRKMTKQPENQLEKSVNIESSNSDTESFVKNIEEDTKPTESNKELGQEINIPVFEVDLIAHQNQTETKKKNIKPKKKNINLNQDQNSEPLETDTIKKRTLRERKPNLKYVDKSEINGNDSKETNSKNRKVPKAKSSQEHKENSCEPPVESKPQRKTTVKGNKKLSSVNSVLKDNGNCPENTDRVETLNNPKNQKLEICSEKQNDNIAPKKTNIGDKLTVKNNKKETEDKKKIKMMAKTNPKISVEENEELINDENVHTNIDGKQNTSKMHVAVMSTATTKKTQSKNRNSSAQNDAKQPSEAHAESENAGALIDDEHLKLVLRGTSSLKSSASNKARSGTSPETKNRRKTVCKTSLVKHADDNALMKPAEKDADGSSQSTMGKAQLQSTEENDKIRKKTIPRKQFSMSQSRVKQTNSDACEHTVPEDENCPETESCESSSGKKRKSEEMECGANHSGSASKRTKHDDKKSGKINNAERGFRIKDLFGMQDNTTLELQPGVMAARSIHIQNFVMMGEVTLEPGATLDKISTNTTFSVQEGTASVTIKRYTKCFNASDANRRFFIPKNIDVSITNVGNLPLKMEFSKFRG